MIQLQIVTSGLISKCKILDFNRRFFAFFFAIFFAIFFFAIFIVDFWHFFFRDFFSTFFSSWTFFALKNSVIEGKNLKFFEHFFEFFFSRNRNFFGLTSSLESVYNACKVSSNLVKWFRRNRYRTHTQTHKRFLLLGFFAAMN